MACGSVDIQGTFEAKGVSNAKSRLQFVAAEVLLCLLSVVSTAACFSTVTVLQVAAVLCRHAPQFCRCLDCISA